VAGRVNHKVLGEVEQIQFDETSQLSTLGIEIIEICVLLTLVFFILFSLRKAFPKEKRHLSPED
jgi:hypothetical protein